MDQNKARFDGKRQEWRQAGVVIGFYPLDWRLTFEASKVHVFVQAGPLAVTVMKP